MSTELRERTEWLRCRTSAAYFACHYVEIYDATSQGWLKFDLVASTSGHAVDDGAV